MSRLRLLRQVHLEKLRESVAANKSAYIGADKSAFPDPEVVTFEIDVEADLELMKNLKLTNSHDDEVHNCLLVHQALASVTPELARDERLWAYLTHYVALEYSSKRWPVEGRQENVENYILDHFFARTKRGAERDNAISRLWWIAHIAGKADTGALEENLDALLQFADVRANLIERPTTGRSQKVLTAVLEMLRAAHVTFKKKQDKGLFERNRFRRLMAGINALGGYIMLDALDTSKLKALFESVVPEAALMGADSKVSSSTLSGEIHASLYGKGHKEK